MSVQNQDRARFPSGELTHAEVLGSVDNEIAFYRRRAGQVFFLGVSAEAVIFAGASQISVPEASALGGRVVYYLFFSAVAAVGIFLGLLYQHRIRELKRKRDDLVESASFPRMYPSISSWQSEILVLCVSLVFLSCVGVWLAKDGAFDRAAQAGATESCDCENGSTNG